MRATFRPDSMAVLVMLFGFAAPAWSAVTSSVSGGVLTAASDGADAIAVVCSGGNVLVNGANPGSGAAACASLTQIFVTGAAGANAVDLSAVNAASFPALIGCTIQPGDGNDVVVGSQLADEFVWNPGDDNDAIDGMAGNDRLRFNASNATETILLSNSGGSLQLTRDIGLVALSAAAVERVDLHLLGGADTVTINDLSGTPVTDLRIDLAATPGGTTGDGAADRVVVEGSPGIDQFALGAAGPDLLVTRAAQAVRVGTGEAGDLLVVNGQGLDDEYALSAATVGRIPLQLDGGAGIDRVAVTATAAAETVQLGGIVPMLAYAGNAWVNTLVVESLTLDLLAGDDQFVSTSNPAGLLSRAVHGGAGNDTLNGSASAVDQLFGGPDDDVMVWNPGGGNDVLEGDAGNDTVRFNASNAAEIIQVAPNGARVTLVRNIGNVLLDIGGVERGEIALLGGADALTVSHLGGTPMQNVAVSLDVAGSGDAAADQVELRGSGGSDAFVLAAIGGVLRVAAGGFQVDLAGAEAANDRLAIAGLAGDDTLLANAAVLGLMLLQFDGGVHGNGLAGGDRATLDGEGVAETYGIGNTPAEVTISRIVPMAGQLTTLATEVLQLNAGSGADTVNTQPLPGVRQELDGGAPTGLPGDSLNVAGFSGDVFASPIVVVGAGNIAHAGFEQSTNQMQIEAFATGRQMVPAVATSGRGFALATLNPAQDAFSVQFNFGTLFGASTAAHIHGPAARGVSAAALISLPASGANNGSFSAGPFALSPLQRDQLKSGLWYFDVHSTVAADGEVRGQFDQRQMIDGFE